MKHPLGICTYLSFVLALLVILPAAIDAQTKKKDNLGTEFYVAFAENQGGQGFGVGEDLNFFALYITSKVATTGVVEVAALNFKQLFTTTPGTITTIELPDGKQLGDPSVEIRTDEQIIPGMAVHVTSQEDVAVYGISSKEFSTDAFMALPVDVLGTEYRTMNYTSSVRGDTPGEFWVVGVQDSTNVTIFPKDFTANSTSPGSPIKVLLYKGDVFLVQGVASDPTNDLTGSLIESDQPIAVLSGHVRTEMPYGFANIDTHTPSRNHLVEQLPPVSAWGDSALVVRYKDALLPDLVRVVSSEDDNVITSNGVVVATLKAGDFFEITALPGPTSIQGTSPIMVGQFLHTDQYSTTPPKGKITRGDPAYALVFPVEQFDTSYTFIEAQRDLFTHNYVNVVADKTGLAGMTLDGTAIPAASFQPIPGSNYVYAQIEVPIQGAHNIFGPKPFGITVYALGPADAYAYTGGSLLKTITPFKTVDLIIDFGDRIMTADPGPTYHDEIWNHWDTTVYLQNISSDPYIVTGFATRTGNDTNFVVTKPVTPPAHSIGPGVIDSMTILFRTTQPGIRMHTKINALTEHLRAYVVDVYGRGILPSAEIFSDSVGKKYIDTLDFGILQATDNPKDSFVYVFNRGPVDLLIDNDDISGINKSVFSIQDRFVGATKVATPYLLHSHNTLALGDTGARMNLEFKPGGLANGYYEAQLDVFTKGQLRTVILIARIKTILKSRVTPASFDSAFVCQEQTRSIFVDNPNDFPITVTNLKLTTAVPSDFRLITGIPLTIAPGGRAEIQLVYAPSAPGISTGTAILNFDLPKGFADTMMISAVGDQLTSKFSARDNIHILPGESTVFPIYAKTPMETFGSSSFTLTVSYDPTHLEDVPEEYIQDNTLTAYDSYTVYGDTAGFRQYICQTLDGSPITGGSATEVKPIIYLKFKSHLNGEDPLRFHEDNDINYIVEFTNAPVPSGCIVTDAPTGRITLDSSCETVYLNQDTILYPPEEYIENVHPNPVTEGKAHFVIDVPSSAPRPSTTPVPSSTAVRLDVIDVFGNQAASVLDEERRPGTYDISWDASKLPPGMYFVRLQSKGQTKLRKMIVAR